MSLLPHANFLQSIYHMLTVVKRRTALAAMCILCHTNPPFHASFSGAYSPTQGCQHQRRDIGGPCLSKRSCPCCKAGVHCPTEPNVCSNFFSTFPCSSSCSSSCNCPCSFLTEGAVSCQPGFRPWANDTRPCKAAQGTGEQEDLFVGQQSCHKPGYSCTAKGAGAKHSWHPTTGEKCEQCVLCHAPQTHTLQLAINTTCRLQLAPRLDDT